MTFQRLILTSVPAIGQLQAVAAGKHLTIFRRSPSAKGAGRQAIKDLFTAAAAGTSGQPLRSERNKIIEKALAGKGAGVEYKRSHGSGPLRGKFYQIPAGASVSSQIKSRGLNAVLVDKRPDNW